MAIREEAMKLVEALAASWCTISGCQWTMLAEMNPLWRYHALTSMLASWSTLIRIAGLCGGWAFGGLIVFRVRTPHLILHDFLSISGILGLQENFRHCGRHKPKSSGLVCITSPQGPIHASSHTCRLFCLMHVSRADPGHIESILQRSEARFFIPKDPKYSPHHVSFMHVFLELYSSLTLLCLSVRPPRRWRICTVVFNYFTHWNWTTTMLQKLSQGINIWQNIQRSSKQIKVSCITSS